MTTAKTTEAITINRTELPIREYRGRRVVTLSDVDKVHERTDGTARRNFNTNKKHFIEGEDYFVRNSYEAQKEYSITAPNGLTLITETGYLMLTKSLNDDLSWKIQRQLVNRYFKSSNTSVITITPEMAKELLEQNTNNRGISPANVQKIASDMLSDGFKLNGETIKIYDDGSLADGQHRLMACVLSGKPFQTYVIRGIKKDVLHTIDAGKTRNTVEALNMTGCGIKSLMVPGLNWYFNYGNKLTGHEIECLWKEYKPQIEFLSELLKSYKGDSIIGSREYKAFCLHLLLSENWDREDVISFVDGMREKPTRETNFELTCYYYRQWYLKSVWRKLSQGGSIGERNQYARGTDALLTVAKSYLNGKTIKSFTWKNRAKDVLDTGHKLATTHFTMLENVDLVNIKKLK